MSDTSQPSAPDEDLPLRVAPVRPGDCPFPAKVLAERFGFGGIPVTPEETARCLAARRQLLTGTVQRLTVGDSPASTDLPEGRRPAYRIIARHHADLFVGARRVHIEAITQELAGPGGTNKEVRVYVDGLLEGRSILLGRLGATVNTFPALAVISPGVLITVTPLRWTDLQEVVVEVWQHRHRGLR